MKNFIKFKQFLASNLMLFIDWLFSLNVTIYLILKVFGTIKSASFEVIFALLLPQYIFTRYFCKKELLILLIELKKLKQLEKVFKQF